MEESPTYKVLAAFSSSRLLQRRTNLQLAKPHLRRLSNLQAGQLLLDCLHNQSPEPQLARAAVGDAVEGGC